MITQPQMDDDAELKMINDSLRALRDHFERKGKKFMLAWALFSDDPADFKMKGNMISTSARDIDYLSAVTNWTCMAVENLNGGPQRFKI